MLPFSKETPKEMLPMCVRSENGNAVLKPILEVIYESLHDYGYREFCFIVGRGKRSIEDYFLIDDSAKYAQNVDLQNFYKRIRTSHISYVQQSAPNGFGDAVLKAKIFSNEPFLLHAGDDVILSVSNDHIRRLEDTFFSSGADLVFLVDKVDDPTLYGVVEGERIGDGVIRVEQLEEKPKRPKTNLAIVGTYIFRPLIFDRLEMTKPDKNGEIQLTDAIKSFIADGKCFAVELKPDEKRLDVGTPLSYVRCLNMSLDNLMPITASE